MNGLTGFGGREGCRGRRGESLAVESAGGFVERPLSRLGERGTGDSRPLLGLETPFGPLAPRRPLPLGPGIAAGKRFGDNLAASTTGDLALSSGIGSCFSESSRIGDMSSSFPASLALVGSVPEEAAVDVMPQSSKSGNVSSSSPAQSRWLPGVVGLFSIAIARARSTKLSICDLMSNVATAGSADRWGGASLELRGEEGPENALGFCARVVGGGGSTDKRGLGTEVEDFG